MKISSPSSNDNGLSTGAVDYRPATTSLDRTQIAPEAARKDGLNTLETYEQTEHTARDNVNELHALRRGQAPNTNGRDPVVNPHGAPALSRPTIVSTPDLALQMSLLFVKTSDERKDAGMQNIRAKSDANQKNLAAQMVKVAALAENATDQAKSSFVGKVCNWIGSVAAVVGALVMVGASLLAAIATGGAAVPFLLISVVALASASLSLANQVAEEIDGPSKDGTPKISLEKMITSVCVSVLESVGMDHDKAVSVGKDVAGLAGMAGLMLIEPQLAGTFAQSVCEKFGVSPENTAYVVQVAGVAASVASAVVIMAVTFVSTGGLSALPYAKQVVLGGTALVSGLSGMAKGAATIYTANKQYDAGYLRADNEDLKTASLVLRKQMDADQDMIKNLLKAVEDGMSSGAQIVREYYDSVSQISNNISRRSPA